MSLEEFKATVNRLVKAVTTDDDPYNDPTDIAEWNKPIMKTTELIEKLDELRFVTAELHGAIICIYKRQHGDKVEPLPFYKINIKATELKEGKTEVHREASQGGLTLVGYDKIITLLKKYLATPVKDREDTPLYYVKLPSGHYMVTLQDGMIGWRSDIQLAQAYTEVELKELNELYWTLAIPAFPDFLRGTKED